MSVLFLCVTCNSQTASEESEMPDVGASNPSTGVDAEYSDTGKWGDGSDPEAEHIRDGGDRDGDGGFSIGFSDSLGNCVMDGCSSPGSQHDKGVIYSNTQHQEWSCKIDTNEVHPEIHDEAKCGDRSEDC